MITSQSNEIRSGCVPIEARKVLRTDASGTSMAEAIPEMIPANIMASRKKRNLEDKRRATDGNTQISYHPAAI